MFKAHGFTLVELLVSACIISILISMGTPALSHLLDNNRATTATSLMIRSLQLARTSAILNQRYVCMANYNDSWGDGWQIFEDNNRNCEKDSDERELIKSPGPSSRVHIIATASARKHVLYAPNGQSQQLSGAFQADSIYLCVPNSNISVNRIVISRGGRVRSEQIRIEGTPCAS